MRPMPIRYVRDMDAATRFYQALGLDIEFMSRAPRNGPPVWVELQGGHGALALHHVHLGHDQIELAFIAEEPLEDVFDRLTEAGFPPATAIVDEAFGRSFTVQDPEGLMIQINEHDRELHGG